MANKIQYAGEFDIDVLEIVNMNDITVKLSDITIELNIFEDIFMNAIQGSIIIGDTDNILTNFNIVGQEFLRLKIKTPGLKNKEDILDFTDNPLFVYKIDVRKPISSGGQIYELLFTSKEAIDNQRIRVSKSYKDSIQNIVTDLITNENFINSEKLAFIESTKGNRKIVAPNVHPFTLIDKLKRESISLSDGSSEFLFFENKDGFYFTSLSYLYSKPIVAIFHDGDKMLNEDRMGNKTSTDNSVIQSFRRIIDYQVVSNKDFAINVVGGMLGSELTTHNIFTKSYERSNYSYHTNFLDHPRIEGDLSKKTYSIGALSQDFGSFAKSNIKLHPTSATADNLDTQHYDESGNLVYSDSRSKDWMLHRQSRITELNNNTFINMKVHGITNLKVGDIIEANFPVVGNDHKNYKIDPFLSGRYLISKIRHTFSPTVKTHEINMQIVRDCMTTVDL